MEDKDIIKALECCQFAYDNGLSCNSQCPMRGGNYCQDKLVSNALALINRQQAEIERLKGWQDLLKAEKHSLIKAEAYKECIEKVKEEINNHSYGVLHKAVINHKLDNLVKEMVGEG